MIENINKIQQDFDSRLESVSDSKQLEQIRIDFLGKKGQLQGLMKELRNVSSEEKPNFGKDINIFGTSYDANNLNKFLNQKSKNNILRKINKSIDIDLKNIDTPLAKKLKNFKLIGVIEKGKFVKI